MNTTPKVKQYMDACDLVAIREDKVQAIRAQLDQAVNELKESRRTAGACANNAKEELLEILNTPPAAKGFDDETGANVSEPKRPNHLI